MSKLSEIDRRYARTWGSYYLWFGIGWASFCLYVFMESHRLEMFSEMFLMGICVLAGGATAVYGFSLMRKARDA